MSSEIYSGAIDWDKVYRAFYHPSRIAECILAELNGSADSVVFSGFAETASFLADKLPVTFVDYSPSVTARARERYPKLGEVLTGDVTQLLALLPGTSVAIACRISAYWNSTEQFQRLANSVLAFTRERILIDFFDRDLVESGHSIAFNSVDGTGKWRFRDFKESVGVTPPFSTATLTVSYSLSDLNVGYEDHRSFFRRGALQQWGRSMFREYDVEVGTSLLDSDPSFLLKLVRKRAGSQPHAADGTPGTPDG